MKWALFGALLMLVACSQAPEPVLARPVQITMAICEATQSVGERCRQSCECLRPAVCISKVCTLAGQPDGALCVENKQCLSGYCTESGSCSRPDGATGVFACEKTCRDRYTGERGECYTVCKYR
ncbi:MAG: hypothetical protein QW165_05000 [Candidatus Woesearchaeota archaeon]